MGPGVPIVNVGIGPTEGGGFDADNGIGAARFRVRPVSGGQSGLCGCFDERTHGPIVYQLCDLAYPYEVALGFARSVGCDP